MNKEAVLGVIRHLITSLGTLLVAKGVVDEASLQAIAGGVVAGIGLIWSIVSKKKTE